MFFLFLTLFSRFFVYNFSSEHFLKPFQLNWICIKFYIFHTHTEFLSLFTLWLKSFARATTFLRIHCKWRSAENPIWISYFESHSLSDQIRIYNKVNCFHLWSVIFQICMLVISVNSRRSRRSWGEGRELPPTYAWRQFPALLFAPVVEPRVVSHNTGNRESK